MSDPDPGQGQLFSVAASPSTTHTSGVLKNSEIQLDAEQVEQARREWPDATPAQQIHYMKSRIRVRMGHETVVDHRTGRRAIGGPQPKPKKRLDQSLTEAADDRVTELVDAAFSTISPDNPNEVRHKSAINIIKVSQEMKRLELKEDELERASEDEIRRAASAILADMVRNGEVKAADFNLAEEDVVELDG